MRASGLPQQHPVDIKLSDCDDDFKAYHAMAGSTSPTHYAPTHSRDSSTASNASSTRDSNASSVVSPSFPSTRGLQRWPSSASSLGSTPESSINVAKPALENVAEEPHGFSFEDAAVAATEPLCICDTPFCEHRKASTSSSDVLPPASPEWRPGDDNFSDYEVAASFSSKRRRSGTVSGASVTSRMTKRWPSISKRLRDRKPTTSVSNPVVQSAPSSRPSSLRLPRESLASHLQPTESATSPSSRVSRKFRSSSAPRSAPLQAPREISTPEQPQDPHDHQEQASTPIEPEQVLLPDCNAPPKKTRRRPSDPETAIQSPLQSPSVAPPSAPTSGANTPISTPILPGYPTPPLSAKPSISSINNPRPQAPNHHYPDVPPLTITEEPDLWSNVLGHADFHVTPEPYHPDTPTTQTCTRLLEDWDTARTKYMRQASRISEHYGPTSHTYALTEQKWSGIDAQWRANLEAANAAARARGETPTAQSLAELKPRPAAPQALDDPLLQPGKFLAVDKADWVGPMVEYAKVHQQQQQQQRPVAKKPALLRLFTDPVSLLGGRSMFRS